MNKKQVTFVLTGFLIIGLASGWFYWYYCDLQEFLAHQNRIVAFCVSTSLPYKQCKIESPNLIVIAQNETEFRQAITNLNATTIYYSNNWSDGFYVYVFSSDYKIAHRYYVP